jgi:putative hemolysin
VGEGEVVVSTPLRIVVIFLLVLGNAIFVAAEYALVTARRSRIIERAREGGIGARTALRLMDDPVRFISTVQVGITISAILLGAIGEPLLSGLMEPPLSTTVAFLISFTILTYLSVVVGELVPKAVALQKAELLAIALAVPLDWLARITYPLVWLLQTSANLVLRVLRVKPAPAGMIAYTREDIRHSVAAAEDVGELEQAEEEMLYKVFDFASKEVSAVMVPRPDVVAISVDMPPEDALATVVDSPYTRYPVFRESLDDIVGVLHVRDLFAAMHDLGISSVTLESITRPAYVVPETKDLAALLADFRREKQHMAIVIDEYGDVDGIVTLEDVLEEIVGEIEDEFDLPDTSIERVDENRIRVDGSYTIDDFNEEFETELEQDGFHTIAGFVFGKLGRAAEVGDSVRADGLRVTVLEVDGTRIQKLEVEFGVEEEPPPGEHEAA